MKGPSDSFFKSYIIHSIVRAIRQDNDNLRQVLEDNNIRRCDWCKIHWSSDYSSCDICDKVSCNDHEGCPEIKHVQTWNLSGMWMCGVCRLITCHNCARLLDEKAKHENGILCSECIIQP